MNGVTVSYEAHIERLRRYGRRRYSLRLYADGIFTGLAFDRMTFDEARGEAGLLRQDPEAVIEFHGMTDSVAQLVYEERGHRLAGVRPGDFVRMRHGTGRYPAGTRCEVLSVDLTEDWEALDAYPVVVQPVLTRDEVGLELDEIEEYVPLGVQAWGRR